MCPCFGVVQDENKTKVSEMIRMTPTLPRSACVCHLPLSKWYSFDCESMHPMLLQLSDRQWSWLSQFSVLSGESITLCVQSSLLVLCPAPPLSSSLLRAASLSVTFNWELHSHQILARGRFLRRNDVDNCRRDRHFLAVPSAALCFDWCPLHRTRTSPLIQHAWDVEKWTPATRGRNGAWTDGLSS